MAYIKDKKTGAIKEVKDNIASTFIGTGRFVLVDKKDIKKPIYNTSENKEIK